MEIKQVGLDQIKPYWRNPRENALTIDALKESIEKFGFNVPIVLDKNNVIITGHARYKALLELGKKTAPCIIVDLDERKAREYRISDNKIHEMSLWDTNFLRSEAMELQTIVGFSPEELGKLFDINNAGALNYTAADLAKAGETVLGTQVQMRKEFLETLNEVTCPKCATRFRVTTHDLTTSPGRTW
jgi:ParB-like chromosome segregation protein Spo0J